MYFNCVAITIPIAALQAHSQIVLSRGESGLLATLALTLSPFLADAIFPVAVIMGPYVEPVSKWDGLAVVIGLIGVLLYSWSEFDSKKSGLKFVVSFLLVMIFCFLLRQANGPMMSTARESSNGLPTSKRLSVVTVVVRVSPNGLNPIGMHWACTKSCCRRRRQCSTMKKAGRIEKADSQLTGRMIGAM